MISRSFADKGDLTTLANVTYDNISEQVSLFIISELVKCSPLLTTNFKSSFLRIFKNILPNRNVLTTKKHEKKAVQIMLFRV